MGAGVEEGTDLRAGVRGGLNSSRDPSSRYVYTGELHLLESGSLSSIHVRVDKEHLMAPSAMHAMESLFIPRPELAYYIPTVHLLGY